LFPAGLLDEGVSLASFYKDSEYLLVTAPGTEKAVIQKLIEQGYTNVAGYLKGGFEVWRSADKPFSRMV
jgi:rhodanese-related sulfurtransferase